MLAMMIQMPVSPKAMNPTGVKETIPSTKAAQPSHVGNAKAEAPVLRSSQSGDNAWTMSQENVEVVREGFEAFKRGDLEQAFSMLSADVSWDGVPGVEPCRTREEVERTIRLNYEAGS